MTDIRTQLRDPIFKGCTRPPMLLGVPMVPLILVLGIAVMAMMWGMLISQWLALWAVVFAIASVVLMRHVTSHDDQRLRQWQLHLALRLANRSRRFWGCTSYSANNFKRR